MKKYYLIIWLSVLFCMTGRAQTRYTSTYIVDTSITYLGTRTPICNWSIKYSVSFSTGYFHLVKHTDFFNTALPTPVAAPACAVRHAMFPNLIDGIGAEVNDIYIHDNLAFFCGSYYDTIFSQWRGLWGYFDVREFLGSNLSIHVNILRDIYTNIAPSTLYQIVAYPEGGTIKVATYGEEYNTCNKIIEIPDALLPTPVSVMYDLPCTPGVMCKVHIDDMTLTKSYVFFSGHDNTLMTGNYIWYCFYDRANFSPSYFYNNYLYSTLNEDNGRVICTAIKDDTVALAYDHVENNNWYARMRLIDLNSNININAQQYNAKEKGEILKIRYLSDLSTIELIRSQSNVSYFVKLFPFYTSTYATNMLTPMGTEYNFISTIGGHHYIASNNNTYYLQDRTYYGAVCPTDNELKVECIDKFQPIGYPQFTLVSVQNIPYYLTTPITQKSVEVQCFSFE